jgi:hypothetical protein
MKRHLSVIDYGIIGLMILIVIFGVLAIIGTAMNALFGKTQTGFTAGPLICHSDIPPVFLRGLQ